MPSSNPAAGRETTHVTAEAGTFFLILALLLAVIQTITLYPHGTLRRQLLPCLLPAAWLQALCVACALAALIVLRLDNDFSVAVVADHSSLALPVLYKITGAWGNHEGSMLLWVLVLSSFGLALAAARKEMTHAVAIQASLAAGVLLFILLTSNPFARRFPPPPDGNAFNPILQDVALAIHPPLLYVGYVGFSIVFSLAVAALLNGQSGREFARTLRPWILASWSSLTIGIGLGSWWAYRELGWGGFWFWDPVENASLLPWLAGTALLHSNIVLQKRGQLGAWVILLSILTFGLSLLGTFLVRSGALTSVHSFATDPARGLFILAYIAVFVGGALLLFALRLPRAQAEEPMRPASREGMIVFNNLFLLSACATVLLGTLYPLFAEWLSGHKLTVGAPYFNATFVPLMALPLLLAGLAPLMPWKQASLPQVLLRAQPALLAAGAMAFLVLAYAKTHIAQAVLGLGLGAWLFTCSVQWLMAGERSLHRLSVFLAHGGAAVLVLGVTGAGLWQEEVTKTVAAGDRVDIAGYRLFYHGETATRGEGYSARQGIFTLEKHGREITRLFPEYRIYDIRNAPTHEAAIHSTWPSDIYAVIGEAAGERTVARLYYVPMIRFVWLGCLLMTLGGAAAFLRRGGK